MLPLIASPPVAQLFAVREGKNGDVEIIGTLFTHESGPLQARLDFSPGEADPENGDEPDAPQTERVWFACPLKRAPIQNGVLGSWPLPRKRDGESQVWTMRLVATDSVGERNQSTLTFNWPLEKSLIEEEFKEPAFTAQPEDFDLLPEPKNIEPLSIVPFPMSPIPAAPAPVIKTPAVPVRPNAPVAAPLPKPRQTETMVLLPVPAPVLPYAPKKPVPNKSVPQPVKTVAPLPPVRRAQKTESKPKQNGGIPSRMKSGSSVPVTVVLRNTGSRSWSSTGESPVRLIYRWVKTDTNTRHRWAVHWLREVVQPGGGTQMKFDLVAPPTSGRFTLTYALVRLNAQNYDGKNYKPPAGNAKDHRWPGEFGAVSFDITVTP